MPHLRLAPLLLLAFVAVVLAGCGSESSSRNASGAYAQLMSATNTLENQGTKFALSLQDCSNVAKDNAAQSACAKQALRTLAGDWAPIGTALTVLETVASDECKQAVQKAVDGATLLDGKDPSVPTTAAAVEALPTQVADAIQQFSQEIAQAAKTCS
jgi:hydroxypyruvate isomerase